eukprot:TRINITY_DN1808_c0_g2_i2.p1 TRINITY_DN1808_c0_g2~~TRINITY_DN1808_c0_g2_i2.p1  ORF type:complete len:389 (-),score=19.38 TRINITY_DN1808_c0_g2_i2:795-1961(-)
MRTQARYICSRNNLLCMNAVLCMILVFGSIIVSFIFITSRAHSHKNAQDLETGQQSLSVLAHHFNNRSLHQLAEWLVESGAHTLQSPLIPIVVYVHARPHYLRQVLDALAEAPLMNRNLVIVSHDFLDATMLDLVGSYNDQRPNRLGYVLQLVYPHMKSNSVGYGDRRQLKHHWWWCMQMVFQQVATGPLGAWLTPEKHFLFLEEDLRVTPDFYVSALAMSQWLPSVCSWPACWGFSLYPHSSLAAPSLPHASVSGIPQLQIHPQVGFSTAAYVLSHSAFHHLSQPSIHHHFSRCLDGFDLSLVYLQLIGEFPARFLSLAPSHVQDIGVSGMHMHRAMYQQRQLDRIRLSAQRSVSQTHVMEVLQNQTDKLLRHNWPHVNAIPFFGKC